MLKQCLSLNLTHTNTHAIQQFPDTEIHVVCGSCSIVTLCDPHGLYPARLLCLWNSPGNSAGVGSCSLLQGFFPTLGSNSGLAHFRWILHLLSHHPKAITIGNHSPQGAVPCLYSRSCFFFKKKNYFILSIVD